VPGSNVGGSREAGGSNGPRKQPEESASVGLPTSGLADDPFAAELRHAYQSIQSGAPFEVTAEDALEALRISLAVRKSVETGKPVKLP